MEAIILAGGLGTRLREVVPDLPKPMAPIKGRPFLEILLTSLAKKRFSRIILSVGYLHEKIIDYFGYEFEGLELVYAIEELPLGTGGAVRAACVRCQADHVFVFNGDTFLDLEAMVVEEHWQACHRPIIVGRMVPDTSRYGRLLIENNQVAGFTEKGVTGKGIINAGCYIFGKDQLNQFPSGSTFSLEKDFLEKNYRTTPFDVFITEGMFIDIGVPEDYELAQTLLVNK
jgi:D-glycero-alpha-D-manno-heptose 1-phosphate guanylyltransferase